MNNLTILTPTYNRASHLRKLYDSLTGQTDPDFEWLVVDDGSTDETQELLKELMQEHRLQMRVLRQENGGKHRALNRGIAQIGTELTFLVDSDDYLPPEAVETIHRYHEKYYETFCKSIAVKDARDIPKNDGNVILCGYSFLRCHADGRVNTAYFPEDEMIGTYRDVRINGNIGGDKAEVFYTEILKRYPFPTFEGEKFLPEDLVWMRMSGPYRMVHINENIYTCDYLEGGLTKSGHRMKVHSPRGMMLRSQVYLEDPAVHFRVRLKMMLLYQIYGRFAGMKLGRQLSGVSQKGLFAVCILPSCLIYLKWKKEG